jgi:hypothetical protein
MKKFVLVLLTFTNTRIPKMNANNKHIGFAIAVIALIGLSLAGCGNGTTSAVKNTPIAADYTISGLSQVFNNEPKPVTITAKPGKSGGTVTVYYEGTDGTAYPKSAAAPSAIGKYAVTFDVAAAAGWEAAAGLSAGTLEINVAAFTTTAAFLTWLSAQPANTAETAYTVVLNLSDISNLSTTLGFTADKYVCLDLSGSTFTSIGDYALRNCTRLTGVTIPDNVTSIGNGVFSNCYRLTAINVGVGNSAYSTVDGVLYSKDQTALHTYPAGKTGAFIIPNSVTCIGNNAFEGCTNLTSVTIPDNVTSIGERAFQNCPSLTSVTIGNGVTSIGKSAFYDCTGLTSVTIPDSVTSIGEYAFRGCTSLTSITIPNSVTTIGLWAFYRCTSLTSVTIPDSVTSIGEQAFAFTKLTSVTVPNSVISIGLWAFIPCDSLTAINVDVVHTVYSSVDGVLYSKDQTVLVTYPAGKTAVSFTIPDSVTSIGEGAFGVCTNLTSVTIPNSVISIGEWAFEECTNLTSVTFEGTISSSGFDVKAFGASGVPWYIGDLRDKFYATDADNGTPGTYTRESGGTVWVKE